MTPKTYIAEWLNNNGNRAISKEFVELEEDFAVWQDFLAQIIGDTEARTLIDEAVERPL